MILFGQIKPYANAVPSAVTKKVIFKIIYYLQNKITRVTDIKTF